MALYKFRVIIIIIIIILFQVLHKISFRFLSTILLVVHYEFILHSTIYRPSCHDLIQLIRSSPITLGKVATNVVHGGFIAIKYW